MESKLIECVRGYIFIYDKRCKLFKNKIAISNAWDDIGKTLKISPDECRNKWALLRNAYTKHIDKDKKIPSGSGACKVKPFKFMEEMSFLRPFIKKRQTFGNINLPNINDQSQTTANEDSEKENNEQDKFVYDGGFSSNLNVVEDVSVLDSDEELFEFVLKDLNKPDDTHKTPQPGPSHDRDDGKKSKKKIQIEDKICDAINGLTQRQAESMVFPEVEHFSNLCCSVLKTVSSKKKRLRTILKLTTVLYDECSDD